jgi:DNA polymerase-1
VLVNYLIQGTAAEVLKMKNLELVRAGLGDYLVLNVHDEVICDVPAELLGEATRVISQVMNDRQMFSVPLTASVDVAERWGAKDA